MTREEKIQEVAEHYEQVDATNLACDYGWGDRDIQQQCFKAGVKWADQHPRKGLLDAEKVTKFIKDNIREYHKSGVFHVDDFVKNLTKAMEE